MVVWQGITSGGTAVPVQVDDEGRVVAQGIDGKDGQDGAPGAEGPQGPAGPEGPAGADGLWREVNSRLIMPAGNTSVQVGLINLDQSGGGTFAENVIIKDNETEFVKIEPAGVIKLESDNDAMASAHAMQVKFDGTAAAVIDYDGAASFAGGDLVIDVNGAIQSSFVSGLGGANFGGTLEAESLVVGDIETQGQGVIQSQGWHAHFGGQHMYTKFADGTLICAFKNIGELLAPTFTWTFPIAFVDTPAVSLGNCRLIEGGVGEGSGALVPSGNEYLSNSSVSVGYAKLSGYGNRFRYFGITAVGRWKADLRTRIKSKVENRPSTLPADA